MTQIRAIIGPPGTGIPVVGSGWYALRMPWKPKYRDISPDKNPGASLVERECRSCRETFHVQRWRIKSGRGIYCSRACAQKGAATSPKKRAYHDRVRGSGSGYVKLNGRHQHRAVAEEKIGRPLRPGEVVHHINGDRQDNRPENLVVITQSEHINLHRDDLHAGRGDMGR